MVLQGSTNVSLGPNEYLPKVSPTRSTVRDNSISTFGAGDEGDFIGHGANEL
jgi:hypothetical protein